MKKNIFTLSIILFFYAFISLATKQNAALNPVRVCLDFASKNLLTDSFGKAMMYKSIPEGGSSNSGNVVCFRISDTTKILKAANYICKRLTDSCNFTNTTLVFYDTSWRVNYDTTLSVPGKKIVTFNCP